MDLSGPLFTSEVTDLRLWEAQEAQEAQAWPLDLNLNTSLRQFVNSLTLSQSNNSLGSKRHRPGLHLDQVPSCLKKIPGHSSILATLDLN